MRQIEHLPRIQQPLELLQQLRPLITARFRVNEDQHGFHSGRRYGFHHPQLPLVLVVLLLLLLRLLSARRAAAAAPRLLLPRRLPQATLEAALPGQLHDPRWRHNDGRMNAQLAILADLLNVEARLLVVIGELAPAATHSDDLLRGEAKLRLERLAAIRAFPLLGAAVYPVVLRVCLFPVLADPNVPETRFTGEI